MKAELIIDEIKSLSNPELVVHLARFFKTGKGDYAEGDLFYGIKVPEVRKVAKKYYKNIGLDQIDILIKDPYHEVRFIALVILVMKFRIANEDEQEKIFNLYINNVQYINNWDLVDVSAPNIVGAFLHKNNNGKLLELAESGHLWSERIAVLATFYFIKQGEYDKSLELSEHFLSHKHDLMHKATGWMLREVGKKDINVLYSFLDEHSKVMPRTMLRYAIEKIPAEKRIAYMKK